MIKWDLNSNQPDTIIPIEFLLNNNPSEIDNEDGFIPCGEIKFFDYFDLVDSSGRRNETKIFEYLEYLL